MRLSEIKTYINFSMILRYYILSHVNKDSFTKIPPIKKDISVIVPTRFLSINPIAPGVLTNDYSRGSLGPKAILS